MTTYQFSSNNELSVTSTTDLNAIANSSGISNILDTYYPTLAKVMAKYPLGVFKALVASGALCGGCQLERFDISTCEKSSNGPEAWAKYLKAIITWLENKVNSAKELESIRQELAEEIHDNYREQLPFWPSVGEYSEVCSYTINKKGDETSNAFIYLYEVSGIIKMQDYRKETYLYQASIWGDPAVSLKCLRLDRCKLKQFESLPIECLEKCARKCETKSISYLSEKLQKALQL